MLFLVNDNICLVDVNSFYVFIESWYFKIIYVEYIKVLCGCINTPAGSGKSM